METMEAVEIQDPACIISIALAIVIMTAEQQFCFHNISRRGLI
jgi:hypothetical protein